MMNLFAGDDRQVRNRPGEHARADRAEHLALGLEVAGEIDREDAHATDPAEGARERDRLHDARVVLGDREVTRDDAAEAVAHEMDARVRRQLRDELAEEPADLADAAVRGVGDGRRVDPRVPLEARPEWTEDACAREEPVQHDDHVLAALDVRRDDRTIDVPRKQHGLPGERAHLTQGGASGAKDAVTEGACGVGSHRGFFVDRTPGSV